MKHAFVCIFEIVSTNTMEPISKHGTAYNSFILVLFLASFGIAISLALFSLPSTVEIYQFREILILFAQIFGSLYAVSLAILNLWFILRYKHWVYKGLVAIPVRKWPHSHLQLVLYKDNNGNEEPVHGGHSSWLQIVLFGIGSIAYLVSNLVKVALDTNVDKIEVIKNLITLACCLLSIITLKLYNGLFLRNTRFFQRWL